MKHLKVLGLAVMAVAALMAFAGSASAAVLTSPAGTNYSGELNATAGSSLLLKAGFANITCTSSTVAGNVESNTASVASGKITTLSYSNCGSATVTPIKQADGSYGKLEVATGGKVKGSGSEVTVAVLGTSCVYGTKTGTNLGTLTSGSPASMKIEASLPLVSGGFVCANPATWEGTYTVTKPNPLTVD